ncbi:MAG TPA: stage II sporulation protein M, partial [Planctomycetota bacterium]|nr:stage II sporulation protein M [Planctomycetota bacterium]
EDRVIEVETPEHVSIEYPLAGLGSRFSALLADFLLIAFLFFGVPLAALSLLTVIGLDIPGALVSNVLIPILILYLFGVFWGYFFFFEGFRDGQTPGKKWMSIRVVLDEGHPITIEAAAIRSLVRVIDLQGLGLVGGIFMLLSPRGKRLGDMAASTVVVRELPAEFPEVADLPGSAALPRISDAAFLAIEKYADRRAALRKDARERIAGGIAQRLLRHEALRSEETPDEYIVRFHSEERVRRMGSHRSERAGSAAASSLLRAKRARWEEFRAMAWRLRGKGLRSADEDSVGEFAARYRELTADLARARTYGASTGTLYALERLVGAGHNVFYRPAKQSFRRAWRWVAAGFPALVRRRWLPIAAASVLLFGTGLLSHALVLVRPDLEGQLVPAEMIARAEEAPARREAGTGYIDIPISAGFLASAIVANNIQVSFLCFALGVTAGIGTALVLCLNGFHLGTVLAAFQSRGALDVIGSFVLPHGIIELTAIAIAGGAGLWMGSGLILPGRTTRRTAFTARAKEAVSLIGGVIVLLIVAGLIEGFVSPARIPTSLKLLVAAVAAVSLALYLVGAGRKFSPPPDFG